MGRLQDYILAPDTRANQPAASSVSPGTLYCVTDEDNLLERSNGTTWETFAGGAGSLVLLEQHAASSSAELLFTDFTSALFDEYQFHFIGIRPATDGADFLCRFSTDGGATYDSRAIYDDAFQYVASNNTSAAIGNVNRTFFDIGGDADNGATGGLFGVVTLYDPLNTTTYKVMHGRVCYKHDSVGQIYIARSVVYRNDAEAVNAAKFYYDSGNIATGKVRCYGVLAA